MAISYDDDVLLFVFSFLVLVNYSSIFRMSFKFITDAIEGIKIMLAENRLEEGKYNFLTYLMSRKELSHNDVMIITLSLFSDGLSTVRYRASV